MSINVTDALRTAANATKPTPNDYSEAVYVLLVLPNVFIFVVVFFGFTSSRTEKRRKEIKDVRTRIAEAQGEVPLIGLGRFGNNRYFEELKKETKRCADIQRVFGPDKAKCVTPGWGRMDSVDHDLHYATEVAASYHTHILGRHEDESTAHVADPRDYLLDMCRRNPNVREKTCLQYLKLYEMARFGASEIDEAMFETFIQVRDELAGALHPAAHPVFQ
mmetsp:Transcript_2130/g.4896  ORF Transcript_2130/g.4896 Transcript_2130/m.4896 type:complete len:219 (+) Transcript_2130:199-855(+)